MIFLPRSFPLCCSTRIAPYPPLHPDSPTVPPPPLLLPHRRRRPPRRSNPFLLLAASPPHRCRCPVAPARPHPPCCLPLRAHYPFLPPPHHIPCLPPHSVASPSSPSPCCLPIAAVPARIHVWERRFFAVRGSQAVASHGRCCPFAVVRLLGTNPATEAVTEGRRTSSSRSPRHRRRFSKKAAGEASCSSIPFGSVGRPCRTFSASPAKAAKQSKQAITSSIGINRSTYLSMCL